MVRFKRNTPKQCPYCLEYSKEFDICIECGRKVCSNICSIEHGSVSFCCECFTISKRTNRIMKETIDRGIFTA